MVDKLAYIRPILGIVGSFIRLSQGAKRGQQVQVASGQGLPFLEESSDAVYRGRLIRKVKGKGAKITIGAVVAFGDPISSAYEVLSRVNFLSISQARVHDWCRPRPVGKE